MKIGVVSDTHIPVSCCELPSQLLDALRGVDLILHAGDLVDLCVVDALEKISKVEAVYGNMDPENVSSKLRNKIILDIEDRRIGLMHGRGRPDGLVDVLKAEFLKDKVDIIVFGHSHAPFNKYIDGILFFNPGSATDDIYAPCKSCGIIEISKGAVKSEIIKL